jgi:hypothetical protein
MDIKTVKLVSCNRGNVGWSEEEFIFHTGQKARFHTHSHKTTCYNGMGKDITETEIGQKMIKAIEQYSG